MQDVKNSGNISKIHKVSLLAYNVKRAETLKQQTRTYIVHYLQCEEGNQIMLSVSYV